MSTLNAKPAFSGKKKLPQYYTTIRIFIDSLRSTMTLQAIASMLNQSGYLTPTDRPWSKQTVANFMRNTSL